MNYKKIIIDIEKINEMYILIILNKIAKEPNKQIINIFQQKQ